MLLGRLILHHMYVGRQKQDLLPQSTCSEALHVTYSRFHLLSPAANYWIEGKPNRLSQLRTGKTSVLQTGLLGFSAQKTTLGVASEPSVPGGTLQSTLSETLAESARGEWWTVVKLTINQMLTRPLTSTASMKVSSIKKSIWFKKTLLWWVRLHPVFQKSVAFVVCMAQLTPYLMLQAWKHFPLQDLIWSNFQKSLQGKQRYLMSPACP